MIKKALDRIPERIRLLLFWPVFGIVFWYMEIAGTAEYHIVRCALDDKIPFCRYFIIPYYFWFIFLIGMIVYGFFKDLAALKNYMRFTAITYTVTLIIYAIYPTAQDLRPQILEGGDFFAAMVKFAYSIDTNTNVCPSIHVLGSMAVYFAARKSDFFGTKPWRVTFFAVAVLITISTLFVKQHSVIDIATALALGLIAYPIVYSGDGKNKKENEEQKMTVGAGA